MVAAEMAWWSQCQQRDKLWYMHSAISAHLTCRSSNKKVFCHAGMGWNTTGVVLPWSPELTPADFNLYRHLLPLMSKAQFTWRISMWDKPLYLIARVATVQVPRILKCSRTPCITEPDFCYAFRLCEPRDFRHLTQCS